MIDGRLLCPHCKTWLPVKVFGRNRARWDGINVYCKPCSKQIAKASDPVARQRSRENWARRNHVRLAPMYRAIVAVREAIKVGKLTRPSTCEQCGAGAPIEAAHYDYSRRLDVRWLCLPCHRQWDHDAPKTKGALS